MYMNLKLTRGGMNGDDTSRTPPPPPPALPPPRPRKLYPSPVRRVSSASSAETWELDVVQRLDQLPPFWRNKKRLSKQMSMVETKRELNWERRRRQILGQERKRNGISSSELTDEDFEELKGSIQLGFGFNEEAGQHLCNTLPALDLYFAVNRQVPASPVSSPHSQASSASASIDSEDSWKICSSGESPEQVKTRLRHWAQAVACSVMQCS